MVTEIYKMVMFSFNYWHSDPGATMVRPWAMSLPYFSFHSRRSLTSTSILRRARVLLRKPAVRLNQDVCIWSMTAKLQQSFLSATIWQKRYFYRIMIPRKTLHRLRNTFITLPQCCGIDVLPSTFYLAMTTSCTKSVFLIMQWRYCSCLIFNAVFMALPRYISLRLCSLDYWLLQDDVRTQNTSCLLTT